MEVVSVYVNLKALNTTSLSSSSCLSSATSQRLILPATTATSEVRVIPSISSAAAGLRVSEVDDATLHMRQAAKNFQVADSSRTGCQLAPTFPLNCWPSGNFFSCSKIVVRNA